MCNDGILHIVEDKEKKRHAKNVLDNCVSITTAQCSNAASDYGLVMFLGVGKMTIKTGCSHQNNWYNITAYLKGQ